jgi:hypothetical protein
MWCAGGPDTRWLLWLAVRTSISHFPHFPHYSRTFRTTPAPSALPPHFPHCPRTFHTTPALFALLPHCPVLSALLPHCPALPRTFRTPGLGSEQEHSVSPGVGLLQTEVAKYKLGVPHKKRPTARCRRPRETKLFLEEAAVKSPPCKDCLLITNKKFPSLAGNVFTLHGVP